MKYLAFTIIIAILAFINSTQLWITFLGWLIIYLSVFKFRLNNKLTDSEFYKWELFVFSYILLECFIKFMIVRNVIPGSWFWINRIEHFAFSVSIGILLYPYYKSTVSKLNKFETIIFVLFAVIFVGNLNEFFEYGLRLYFHLTDQYRFSLYYWDTIYDLIANVLGGILGGLVGVLLFSKSKYQDEKNIF